MAKGAIGEVHIERTEATADLFAFFDKCAVNRAAINLLVCGKQRRGTKRGYLLLGFPVGTGRATGRDYANEVDEAKMLIKDAMEAIRVLPAKRTRAEAFEDGWVDGTAPRGKKPRTD